MPLETKQAHARWEFLSPPRKAELGIRYAKAELSLKASVPADVKATFDRLEWGKDQDAIEFRHRKDVVVTDPAEFFRDVRNFSHWAGVDRKILNPEDSALKTANIHYHVSVAGKDLNRVGQALNRLALIRRVESGILNDLKGEGRFLYKPDLNHRGLVRLVAKDRLEFRNHLLPLADEMNFNLRVLNMSEAEAIKAVDAEISRLMTDYVVDKLTAFRPEYLPDFEKNMAPTQVARVQEYLDRGKMLANLPDRLPPNFWSLAPDLLSDFRANIRAIAAKAILKHRDWPDAFMSQVPRLMTHPDPNVGLGLSEGLFVQRNLPAPVLEAIAHWMQSPSEAQRVNAATLLNSQDQWPPTVRRQIGALVRDPSPRARAAAVKALERQNVWNLETWKAMPALLTDSEEEVQEEVRRTFSKQSRWHRQFWNHLPELLKNPASSRVVAKGLALQMNWPPLFWEQVPATLETLPDHSIMDFAYAIQVQKPWPNAFWKHVPKLLSDRRPEAIRRILSALKEQSPWPGAVWQRIPELLAHPDKQVQLQAAFAVQKQGDWPEEIWSLAKRLRNHPDSYIAEAFTRTRPSCAQEFSNLLGPLTQ